jgi:bacteriocin-like protein
MKLQNPFKKATATAVSKITGIDKKELKNVIGGGEPIPGLDVNLEQHPPGKVVTSTTGVTKG